MSCFTTQRRVDVIAVARPLLDLQRKELGPVPATAQYRVTNTKDYRECSLLFPANTFTLRT